ALTPEQVRIRDVCRALAEEFGGRAAEHDRDATSPLKDYEALRDAGLYGLMVPEEFGGLGAGLVGYAVAAEELAQGSPATALSFNMHCALLGFGFQLPIHEAVKQQIADLVVKEGKLLCGSLSEAGHTGRLYSSRTCSTQLRRTDDGYLLNGRKSFCTMVDAADFICVYAHPEEADDPEAAVLVFLPTGLPGLRIEPVWDTLGMRATRSDTLIMEDCQVPPEAVIEPIVPSLPDLLRDTDQILNIPYTAVYLGIGVGAFRAAIAAVRDRVPKGYSQPVAYLPEIRRRVAVMSAQLEAARRLLHYAAWLVDTDAPPAEASAAFLKAKYVVGETVAATTRSALEMGGAQATFKGSPLERFFRDGATATLMPPPTDHCLTELGISELGLDPAEVLPTLR
ncbi:MAG TPA: acyl-CoA dehydrogenase family protein, partial [Acidimicrobiia bacterium]|nr:acyl-CoA dehydrogenase family protein [Acidimicrobiia bacterium]